MAERIFKGDKVRSTGGGPVMDVLGASDKLAICAWTEGDRSHEEIFPTTELLKLVQQLQQQPQPTVEPGQQL